MVIFNAVLSILWYKGKRHTNCSCLRVVARSESKFYFGKLCIVSVLDHAQVRD